MVPVTSAPTRWAMALRSGLVAMAYCCNLAVVLVSHRLFEVNVYLAQVFGTGIYAVIGFLGKPQVGLRLNLIGWYWCKLQGN
jgi:hypothetical protein